MGKHTLWILIGLLSFILISLVIVICAFSYQRSHHCQQQQNNNSKTADGDDDGEDSKHGWVNGCNEAQLIRQGTSKTVTPGMELWPGDVIETGPDGFFNATFKDDSRLTLGNNSRMEIHAFDYNDENLNLLTNKMHLLLEVGQMIVSVGHTAIGHASISTNLGNARCKVGAMLGTKVDDIGKSHIFVLLDNGSVQPGKVEVFNSMGLVTIKSLFQYVNVASSGTPPVIGGSLTETQTHALFADEMEHFLGGDDDHHHHHDAADDNVRRPLILNNNNNNNDAAATVVAASSSPSPSSKTKRRIKHQRRRETRYKYHQSSTSGDDDDDDDAAVSSSDSDSEMYSAAAAAAAADSSPGSDTDDSIDSINDCLRRIESVGFADAADAAISTDSYHSSSSAPTSDTDDDDVDDVYADEPAVSTYESEPEPELEQPMNLPKTGDAVYLKLDDGNYIYADDSGKLFADGKSVMYAQDFRVSITAPTATSDSLVTLRSRGTRQVIGVTPDDDDDGCLCLMTTTTTDAARDLKLRPSIAASSGLLDFTIAAGGDDVATATSAVPKYLAIDRTTHQLYISHSLGTEDRARSVSFQFEYINSFS